MLVYGKNVAKEILKNNKKVIKIILEEGFNDKEIISNIEKRKIPFSYMNKREFSKFDNYFSQGIIIDIGDFKYKDLEETYNDDVVVILDHLEDPHNFGAIIRTCEAAGIKSIIIPKDRSVDVNATVMKTSAGALSNVNIIKVTNLVDTIKKLKKEGFWIVGTQMEAENNYKEFSYPNKTVIVIGNEGKGMSSIVTKECDYLVKIPMKGNINSLNASVSAALIIYEVMFSNK